MQISADTLRLKDLLMMLRKEQRLAKNLQELCHNAYLAAQMDPAEDGTVYWKYKQFFEQQEQNISRRIELLEDMIDRLLRYDMYAKEQLQEGLRRMNAVQEDMYL